MGISEKFQRKCFEQSEDPTGLARSLSEVLTERLIGAADPEQEARAIVSDLKALGHELYSWDESDDWQQWGDDYMRPGAKRFIVQLGYAVDEPRAVSVEFGPWPEPPKPIPCLKCGASMIGSSVRVRGIGHGHVGSADVKVELHLGEGEPRSFSVGQRSQGMQVGALTCPKCGGVWIPEPEAVGYTGG